MTALIDLVDEHATIITVNRRLARNLLTEYGERALASGKTAWRTPDVLPYAAFVRRAWRDVRTRSVAPQPAILSDAQERLLWESAIRAGRVDGEQVSAFSAGIAARQAQAAFALMNAWLMDIDDEEFGRNEDSRAFRTWVRAFMRQCDGGRWIDPGRAATALVDAEKLSATDRNERIVFAGFEILTARQRAMIDALRDAGVEVVIHEAAGKRGRVRRFEFDDAVSEFSAIARWARSVIAKDPSSRVGVIVPDLHLVRAGVERVFEEELCPGSAMPHATSAPRPFNLSLGAPLSKITVIGDALLALELGRERISLEAVGRLLRSPYLRGGAVSLSERARLDARLRDIGEVEISLNTLIARAAQTGFHAPLSQLRSLISGAGRRRPLAEWPEFFSDWFQCLGWPGDRGLDSDEYQAVEAFRGLLDEIARCGVVSAPQSFEQAQGLLRRFADEQIFQPRRLPAPIQIVGALEATGQQFNHLWICGLTDGAWPPAPDPNPFLPVTLQRRAGIPQSSPETQLALARKRLDAWLESAPEVFLSHPGVEGDESLRASPLILNVDAVDGAALNALPAAGFTERLAACAPKVEVLMDHAGPQLSSADDIHAGAVIFADQAACPFRAFAHHRLQATTVAAAVSSFDARVRGNLVHRVLFDVWSGLQNRDTLLELSDAELLVRVESAVDHAIEQERRIRPDTLRGAMMEIERTRLITLVGDWMDIERSRAPFEPAAREEGLDVEINGLSFTVRPDRIDRLESGDYLLVDYKTGDVGTGGWFGDRPDDPQLAIYTVAFESLFNDKQVAGASYGVLRRYQCGFRGFADREDIAIGIETLAKSRIRGARQAGDWTALKAAWREALDNLAGEFIAGDARVAPKHGTQTCRFCDAMPLCRVFETADVHDDGEGR